MRHRAFRIRLRHLLECFPRLRISHVMQQSHRAIELRLDGWRTGNWKLHRAQGCFTGLSNRAVSRNGLTEETFHHQRDDTTETTLDNLPAIGLAVNYGADRFQFTIHASGL